MQRVMQGLLYDTDTAEDTSVGYYSGSDRGDFKSEKTKLYKGKNGRWFLAGQGGPRSRWGQSAGTGWTTGGEGIVPLSEAEARTYVEEHGTAQD